MADKLALSLLNAQNSGNTVRIKELVGMFIQHSKEAILSILAELDEAERTTGHNYQEIQREAFFSDSQESHARQDNGEDFGGSDFEKQFGMSQDNEIPEEMEMLLYVKRRMEQGALLVLPQYMCIQKSTVLDNRPQLPLKWEASQKDLSPERKQKLLDACQRFLSARLWQMIQLQQGVDQILFTQAIRLRSPGQELVMFPYDPTINN